IIMGTPMPTMTTITRMITAMAAAATTIRTVIHPDHAAFSRTTDAAATTGVAGAAHRRLQLFPGPGSRRGTAPGPRRSHGSGLDTGPAAQRHRPLRGALVGPAASVLARGLVRVRPPLESLVLCFT